MVVSVLKANTLILSLTVSEQDLAEHKHTHTHTLFSTTSSHTQKCVWFSISYCYEGDHKIFQYNILFAFTVFLSPYI